MITFKNNDPSTFLIKKQLHWVFVLRILIFTILLGITMLLQTNANKLLTPSPHYLFYFIGGTYFFTLLSLFLLKFITWYRHFAFLQFFADCMLTSLLIILTGCSQSIFTILFFFPIISSAIILFRKGALLLAAIATFSNGAILTAEYFEKIPIYIHPFSSDLANIQMVMHSFSIRGITFFLVGILSAILAERLHKAETELSKTSQSLDRLALLYKQIFDDISTGIITVDSVGRITSFNRSAALITGYGAIDVLGQKITNAFPELTTNTDSMRPMTNLQKKDGQTIPVGYSWTRLNMPGDCENCRVYTMQDLSKIKKMEEKVRQAEKMAAIGELAAGIAHEFRNPLAAISGASQVLENEFVPNTPSYNLMHIIVRECDRLEGTISDFLHFSKPATPEKNWFSLHALVEETLGILKQGKNWDENIKLETKIPVHLDCWADSGQITQIILNLFDNSRNAIGDKEGTITITASEIKEQEKERTLIEVSDDGPGITDRNINKIFEPFFTTRENGTGLGLAIVKQLIESHGGKIKVANNQLGGAVFSFTLPLPLS